MVIDDLSEGLIFIDKTFKIVYTNNAVKNIFNLENINSEKLQVLDLLIIKCDGQSSQSFSKDKMKI